ncbi:hypothetical protein [Aestuariibaculum sediminum]|uniref:Uncharacterized protein n=1 Tax=Aestuariibaculum sediminum TaxID=2770637 RepID=A0A8J6U9U1_9FLAO|nr:hypothetical protein [Aestuariibaculum sediminum]MBD0833747.1 hypothetical protein [Aestuariibaculum sediminum]
MFSIIISGKIYYNLFGDFEIILIDQENFWVDLYRFIVDGRILIVLAIFFFTYYVILGAIFVISFLLLQFILRLLRIKEETIEDGFFLRNLFKIYGVLKYDKETSTLPVPGRNFQYAMNFVNNGSKEVLRDVAHEIKSTSVFELFNLFVIFTLVYGVFLGEFHHFVFNLLIFCSFFILLYFLVTIECVFKLLEAKFDYISSSLKLIEQAFVVERFIQDNLGRELIFNSMSVKAPYMRKIIIKEKEYIICHFIEEASLDYILKFLESEDKTPILVIARKKVKFKGLKKEIITTLKFSNKRKFENKLKKYFNFN